MGLLMTTAFGDSQRTGRIAIGWWNVENLFDTTNDVDPTPRFGSDDEFTPAGSREWTSERYLKKIKNVADVIRSMNEGKGPEVMAVCEVEHEQVLRELTENHLADLSYQILYHESPDPRGIDIGFLYKSALLRLRASGFRRISLSDGSRPTRDILFVEFETPWGILVCIANHWPSRRGGAAQTESRRILAAQACRAIVDSVLAISASADIVVMGDFNDTPADISITSYLQAIPDTQMVKEHGTVFLYNCMTSFGENQMPGTYLYRGSWDMIDQFLLSAGLLDTVGFRYDGVEIYHRSFLLEQSGRFAGAPFSTYGGAKYLGGYSDHLPILIYLRGVATAH